MKVKKRRRRKKKKRKNSLTTYCLRICCNKLWLNKNKSSKMPSERDT